MSAANPANLRRTIGQWPEHFADQPCSTDQRDRIRNYLQRLGRDEASLAGFCGADYVDVDSLSITAAEHVLVHLSMQLRLLGSITRKAQLEREGRLDLWDTP